MKIIYTLQEAKEALATNLSNTTIEIEVPNTTPPTEQKSFPFMEVYNFVNNYKFRRTERDTCTNKIEAIQALQVFVQACGFFLSPVETENIIKFFC